MGKGCGMWACHCLRWCNPRCSFAWLGQMPPQVRWCCFLLSYCLTTRGLRSKAVEHCWLLYKWTGGAQPLPPAPVYEFTPAVFSLCLLPFCAMLWECCLGW